MAETILNVREKIEVDDSIKECEIYEYQPITGTQLNTAGQIIITIENTDAFYHPSRSWLLFEGDLLHSAQGNARYIENNLVALANNALMYMFTNIKYTLAGSEIESLNHPGFATTMLGYCKYAPDYKQGHGLMQCWFPDTGAAADRDTNSGFKVRQHYLIEKPDPKGSFSFAVPLDHIFGFCEDYHKVMYGMRHTLTLVRTTDDNDAIFRPNTPALDGKVILSKISWMMPKVLPNDEMKFKLYKTIETKDTLDVGYRMRQCEVVQIQGVSEYDWRLGARTAPEKPRYIIIGMQTNKRGNQIQNAALFDHCSVKNMYVTLNSTRYPALDVNSDFDAYKFARFYKMMTDFIRDYYGIDPLIAGCAVNPIEYNELFPLYVFDVSKQSERLNQAVVDITVKMKFAGNVGNGTCAYALIISDRRLKLTSDGKKMSVLF